MSKERDDLIIQEEDEIITLTYEDGIEEDFFNIAELDYKGKWYIYLQPVEMKGEFEEDEVLIYEMSEDEESEEIFTPVEDEKLLNELIDMLNKELEE